MIILPHLFVKAVVVAVLQSQMTCALSTDILSLENLPNIVRPNFTSLATKYGHTPVQYDVVTEDGYILTLFRLPGRSRYPVLLLHGILDSADTWILRGEDSPGILLANSGYDVWCANSRGNRYSRRHLYLNPDKDAFFWNYSFHEIGYYDLPAIIDNILKVTRARSISAIGHSQGNTAFFVLGSTRPEYNAKINVLMALAPVTYLHNSKPPISTIIKTTPALEQLITTFKINEVLGDTNQQTLLLRLVCPMPVIGYTLCINGLVFPLLGYDPWQLEPEFSTTVALHFPAGTSSKSLSHFLQVGYRQIFAQFDNGPDGNKGAYNSTTPPPYDLGKVTMPVAMFAAKNDALSTLPDVALLREQLPNVVYYLVNPNFKFNHADYIWGREVRIYLMQYILEVLQTYNRFD